MCPNSIWDITIMIIMESITEVNWHIKCLIQCICTCQVTPQRRKLSFLECFTSNLSIFWTENGIVQFMELDIPQIWFPTIIHSLIRSILSTQHHVGLFTSICYSWICYIIRYIMNWICQNPSSFTLVINIVNNFSSITQLSN